MTADIVCESAWNGQWENAFDVIDRLAASR
jgi:hypothetical protein